MGDNEIFVATRQCVTELPMKRRLSSLQIHLKWPSEFGDKIVFMPKTRIFAMFSSHPVVKELKRLARESHYH